MTLEKSPNGVYATSIGKANHGVFEPFFNSIKSPLKKFDKAKKWT